MAKPYDTWTVTPHGALEKLADNLWTVEARMPGAPINRKMTLAKLRDGRIVVHNAIALGDDAMKEIEAWGTPAFLVVPGVAHRMDAKIYKQRYPQMKVVAPAGAKARIEPVVPVDHTGDAFGDDSVSFPPLDGVGEAEGVLTVRSPSGTTLVFNDAIMNMRSLPGFAGSVMGLFGFTSRAPAVTFPVRMMIVKDRRALGASLEKLADTKDLVRIDMAHGQAVTDAPADALRRAARG